MTAPDCDALDRADPLAPMRAQFLIPEGKTYLDGNSLGALPAAVVARLNRVTQEEWGRDLIASWNTHDWIDMPQRVGAKIAPILGAAPGQVISCDSTSVNLFKLLAAAMALRPGRRLILSQVDNFPTDLYMVQGLATLLGPDRCKLRTVPESELLQALDDDVAVLLLTQVDFRSGAAHDMPGLTRAAHEAGALVLWDLAHSAGVMPLQLDSWGVDMAVGCGYKFLNGGPGAPAFLYLARDHLDRVQQPLTGWMGHRRAFDFAGDYDPAPGIAHFLSGTPGILGMAALDEALDLFDGLDLAAVRQKSLALTGVFMTALQQSPALDEFNCLTPENTERRGSQVSLAHEEGHAIAQALIAAGIIVDFRAPDIVRFGFSPMYNSFADVERAIDTLTSIMQSGLYKDPAYRLRARVT